PPDDQLVAPELEHPALSDFHGGSQLETLRGRAPHGDVPQSGVVATLVQVDDQVHFPRDQRLAVGAGRDLRRGLHDLGRPTIHLTHQLGRCRLAKDDGVVGGAGVDHGPRNPGGQHQNAGENEDDQSDTADGHGRRQPSRPQRAPDVREWNLHPTVLKPDTMGILAARNAGTAAAASPHRPATINASTTVPKETPFKGKKAIGMLAKPFTIGNVRRTPRTPPNIPMIMASPRMNMSTWRPVNPNVLSTAYSRVRSRTAITMVLANTSRIIPMITKLITSSEVMIAPDMATKPCWKAFSLSVFVGDRELVYIVSTSVATFAMSSGRSILRTNHPAPRSRPGDDCFRLS